MPEDKTLVFLLGADRLIDMDQAAAVALWAKRAGKELQLVNQLQGLRIRAEVKAGELLKAMPKQQGSRGTGKKVESQAATHFLRLA